MAGAGESPLLTVDLGPGGIVALCVTRDGATVPILLTPGQAAALAAVLLDVSQRGRDVVLSG